MLTVLLGLCSGAVAGWFAHTHRDWLFVVVMASGGTAAIVVFLSVIMPMSSAAGSMELTLWQFMAFMVDSIGQSFLASLSSWFLFGAAVSSAITNLYQHLHEPPPPLPETRDEMRRRIEAEMKFKDSQFN